MAIVTGLTAARMQEIADASVVSGLIDVNGNLLLSTHGGEQIDAGSVIGPRGPEGPAGKDASVSIAAKAVGDLPDTYPVGISTFQFSTSTGWPTSYATVTTIIESSVRGYQLVTQKSTGAMWIRTVGDNTWSNFYEFARQGEALRGTTLRLSSTGDASETSTSHAFQIGEDNTYNIIIDNNEMWSRNNGEQAHFGMNVSGLGVSGPVTSNASQSTDVRALTRKDYVDGKTAPLDSATFAATANTIVKRSSSSTIQVSTGTSGADAANKSYVDGYDTLWSGAGWYMHGTQSAPLSQSVSSQKTGIVLCWCGYSNGAAQNHSWSYTFIPKWHVAANSGQGIHCPVGSGYDTLVKYVYVNNTTVIGNNANDQNGLETRVLVRILGV